MAEEKRRIENRLSTLEEDLEEEQMNSEAAVDKARKAEQQLDALNTEISQLQGNLQKSENAKSQFEKQVCVCACVHACVCMYVYLECIHVYGCGVPPYIHIYSLWYR